MAHYHLALSIAQVESGMDHMAIGDNGRALGAWQMHKAAWTDGNLQLKKEGRNQYPREDYYKPKEGLAVALAYLRLCGIRMRAAGLSNPSPQQYYLCFSMGFQAFKEAGFDQDKCPKSKVDAAIRVGNIFENVTR